jgi:hypothetical protein
MNRRHFAGYDVAVNDGFCSGFIPENFLAMMSGI